ncbi:MAG TPA: malate synthase G [Jatrophihabitantaceae bacterium]|nr:malate synthase G [Jatrophihabitantaceae bacterium]
MTEYTTIGSLRVATELATFVAEDALASTDLTAEQFWAGFATIVADLTAPNRDLLAERDRLQHQIDEWHREHAGQPSDLGAQREFLTEIGYLLPEVDDFQVTTTGVDPEIATLAGPQLVVPVLNARFALNAANARWGSLYDALYGTDAIPEDGGAERTSAGYNEVRGARVVAYVRRLLDDVAPLTSGSHTDATRYTVADGALVVTTADGASTTLAGPARLHGFTGSAQEPHSVLIEHRGLHIELLIDPTSRVGSLDPAGINDVQVEAALTTIVDFEDSVAAVDAEDKVVGYRNWLGLNRGTLTERVEKAGDSFVRRLNDNREFTGADGSPVTLPGRALLLVRNVGSHMRTDAVLDSEGAEIFETLLDATLTALCAIPGLKAGAAHANGSAGAVYIVKPKMHGPAEVAFAVRLFERVEGLLSLPAKTLKIGIMDEERRTTLNLHAAIREAGDRVIFINTGFLDRSGDEIHTAMVAGPVVRKGDMKTQPWIMAYEKHNVEVGLRAGLAGHAQIGKGMWAMPDLMADMLEQKVAQVRTGATTAWVPSPSAATLHALHYHLVDVEAAQHAVAAELAASRPDRIPELLTLPIVDPDEVDADARAHELDNNAQSLLGYVVRWVDQGIGCSKVPDIAGVALMEDRATLRISSQLLANWLAHGVVSAEQITDALRRMAGVVDKQNAGDPAYRPLTGNEDGPAFQAATELIMHGAAQPNGYTEAVLHKWRRAVKAG